MDPIRENWQNEITSLSDPKRIYEIAIRNLLNLKARLDGKTQSLDTAHYQQDLKIDDVGFGVSHYFLGENRQTPLKIIDPEDDHKFIAIIRSLDELVSSRTGKSSSFLQLENIPENVFKNELAYRYYLAREVLSPLIALWMRQTLGEFSKIKGPKRMAFLYRDGYLAEQFAIFLTQLKLPDINVEPNELVALDLNRINVYEDPQNPLKRDYNHNLPYYLADKLGANDGKTIFVVDTGKGGNMLRPFADYYPSSSIHARYYVLDMQKRHPVKTAKSFSKGEVIDFDLIEHTFIPKTANGLHRERSVDFAEDHGHWEPITRSINDLVEEAYLMAFEEGYRDYMADVLNGLRPLPSANTDEKRLEEIASSLLGNTDERFGYVCIKNLPFSTPRRLKPTIDDEQELLRLRDAVRKDHLPDKIINNNDINKKLY